MVDYSMVININMYTCKIGFEQDISCGMEIESIIA